MTFLARGDKRAESGGRGGWAHSPVLAGFLLVCVACFAFALYLGIREPGQDLGRPVPVSARALGIASLPTAAPLPSPLPRPRPAAGSRGKTLGGAGTAPPTPREGERGGGSGEQHAAPESAAEAPVLVPEGEQRP